MPVIHASQTTFGAGEIAPNLHARTDFAKYQSGLKRARNVIISPTGGAYNRPGMRMIALAKDSTHPVRLIEFSYSSLQSYIIELGHNYARFYYNGGQVQMTGASAWVTGTSYVVGNFVTQGGVQYYCVTAHTAGTFATDLANGDWVAQNAYEIPTPWAGADLAGIDFAQSADVMYFTHPNYAPQTLTRIAATNWTISAFGFQNGPWMLDNTDATRTITPSAIKNPGAAALNIASVVVGSSYVFVTTTVPHGLNNSSIITIAGLSGFPVVLNGKYSITVYTSSAFYLCALGTQTLITSSIPIGTYTAPATTGATATPSGGVTLTASYGVFNAQHIGALWKIVHTISAQSTSDTLGAGGATGTVIKCGTTWSLLTSGSWTGTMSVQMSEDGGNTWVTLQSFTSAANANYNTTGETGVSQCLIRTIFTTYSSGNVTANLSANSFDWVGVVQISLFTSSTQVIGTVLTTLGDTVATSEWAEGAWSTYRGFPSRVLFHQDRLFMAGTPAQPDTLWGSVVSGYTDYGVSNPIVDSDSINVNLPSQKLNAIQSLAAPRELMALTSETDFVITSASGVITPTTVQISPQGRRGASAVKPIPVGIRLLLVQPMGSVVREMAFSIYTNSYDSTNLSLLSNHLFTGYTIVDAKYQQEPDSIVWMVRSDGALLSLTYLPEQEVVAWTRHDTLGKFEFIASIPAPAGGYNQLWAVVNRNGTRFIELADQRLLSLDPADQFFVDCGLSFNNPVAITGMTNAGPVVVTAPAHGFNNGDAIDIDGTVVGMEQWTDINGNAVPTPLAGDDISRLVHKTVVGNGYVVANITPNTFQLTDTHGNPVDGSSLSAYISGGNARKRVSSVSGLSHLNGQTVAVLANGFVQNQKVVNGGSITLDTPASRVQVGLPYSSEIETLALEVPQQDGTIQGRKVKIAELTMRVLNTGGAVQVMQGEDTTQLDTVIPASPPSAMGSPEPLFSGDIPRLSIRSGYDYGAHIFVRQPDPLPFMMLGLIPRVAVGG
jgi:hypothetical protein